MRNRTRELRTRVAYSRAQPNRPSQNYVLYATMIASCHFDRSGEILYYWSGKTPT